MDQFQKTFLRAAVAEYDKLSELQKQTGVETRVLARVLSPQLGIDESSVDSPEYQGSETYMKLLNTTQSLRNAGLLKDLGNGPVYWVTPTVLGRELAETWDSEEKSPAFEGQRILRYVYDLQQDIPSVHRRVGMAGQIDLATLRSSLDIDDEEYRRGARWAERQGFLAEPTIDQYSVENGGIYITDDGMSAVENDFAKDRGPSGATINIHDSRVYGSIVAAGRDNMIISSPQLADEAEELRTLLSAVQNAIEDLPEEDDDRHDALQHLESVQREFSKKAPSPGRVERGINLLGGIASISTAVGPQLARLAELVQQLPR